MNYIDVISSSPMRVHVKRNMWFYLAITAPLMVVTLLGWFSWEWRSLPRTKQQCADVAVEDGDTKALEMGHL